MTRLPLRCIAGIAALALAGGCEPGADTVERLCVPGQAVFCRCPDGAPATQTCTNSGMRFEACGPCDGDGDGGGEAPQGSSSTGGEPPGEGRPLFAPCTAASECATTLCSDGYCTSPCYKPSDCPYPKAECVSDDSGATCVPACASDADCSGAGASCQPGQAVDGWVVRTCR